MGCNDSGAYIQLSGNDGGISIEGASGIIRSNHILISGEGSSIAASSYHYSVEGDYQVGYTGDVLIGDKTLQIRGGIIVGVS